MGRIKTLQIKRVTHRLMELHAEEFTDSYEQNKEIVNKLISTPSKKLRNIITGYITRLVKQNKGPKKRHIKQAEDLSIHYETNANQEASMEA